MRRTRVVTASTSLSTRRRPGNAIKADFGLLRWINLIVLTDRRRLNLFGQSRMYFARTG